MLSRLGAVVLVDEATSPPSPTSANEDIPFSVRVSADLMSDCESTQTQDTIGNTATSQMIDEILKLPLDIDTTAFDPAGASNMGEPLAVSSPLHHEDNGI